MFSKCCPLKNLTLSKLFIFMMTSQQLGISYSLLSDIGKFLLESNGSPIDITPFKDSPLPSLHSFYNLYCVAWMMCSVVVILSSVLYLLCPCGREQSESLLKGAPISPHPFCPWLSLFIHGLQQIAWQLSVWRALREISFVFSLGFSIRCCILFFMITILFLKVLSINLFLRWKTMVA